MEEETVGEQVEEVEKQVAEVTWAVEVAMEVAEEVEEEVEEAPPAQAKVVASEVERQAARGTRGAQTPLHQTSGCAQRIAEELSFPYQHAARSATCARTRASPCAAAAVP